MLRSAVSTAAGMVVVAILRIRVGSVAAWAGWWRGQIILCRRRLDSRGIPRVRRWRLAGPVLVPVRRGCAVRECAEAEAGSDSVILPPPALSKLFSAGAVKRGVGGCHRRWSVDHSVFDNETDLSAARCLRSHRWGSGGLTVGWIGDRIGGELRVFPDAAGEGFLRGGRQIVGELDVGTLPPGQP